MFMSWIGVCYAVSQGFIAQQLIKLTGQDPTKIIISCIIFLGLGRVFALYTMSIYIVYLIMAFVIIALGIMNTSMSSACTRLATTDQIGGLFGLMESCESIAGLIGPGLGGLLFTLHPTLPIISVVGIYSLVLIAVTLYFKKTIIDHQPISVINPIIVEKKVQ